MYPFLLNIYTHDFDQFVENLNDKYRNIAVSCDRNNYKELTVQKYKRQCSYKFSNQMLKIYDELVKRNKKHAKFLSHCVTSKGRPFKNV